MSEVSGRGGGGGGHFHSKVIGMLFLFLGYKILILVFFRLFCKISCRSEFLVFLRVSSSNCNQVINPACFTQSVSTQVAH